MISWEGTDAVKFVSGSVVGFLAIMYRVLVGLRVFICASI